MKKLYGIMMAVLVGFTVTAQAVNTNGLPADSAFVKSELFNNELPPVGEPQQSVNATVDLPVLSAFNSRGRTFQDETVFEPNVTVTKNLESGSVFLNTWGNMAPNKYADKGEATFNEIDLTVGYQNAYKKLNYGVGLIEYVYSGTDIPNTHEAYATVSGFLPLNPTASVYYDFKEAKGFYVVGSVNHPFKITDRWTLTADTGLGYGTADYNELYFGVKEDKLNDWNSGLTLAVAMAKNVTLSTAVRYVDLIDKDIENGAEATYGEGDSIVTKIAATITF